MKRKTLADGDDALEDERYDPETGSVPWMTKQVVVIFVM